VAERNILRPVVAILCIGVTVAGLNNVYGDNAGVLVKAETAACGKPHCSVQMTRMSRNPIAQNFTFQVKTPAQGGTARGSTVDVDCQRSWWLVGDYSCAPARGY
jgi:hypothetical protein